MLDVSILVHCGSHEWPCARSQSPLLQSKSRTRIFPDAALVLLPMAELFLFAPHEFQTLRVPNQDGLAARYDHAGIGPL